MLKIFGRINLYFYLYLQSVVDEFLQAVNGEILVSKVISIYLIYLIINLLICKPNYLIKGLLWNIDI